MVLGEIFLTAFIQLLFEKLGLPELLTFLRREGVHITVQKWTEKLATIRDVLDDAEEKQTTKASIKSWLNKLEDLAYDVDDILDEFATEALHWKLTLEPESSKSKVRSLIPTCCGISFSPSAIAFKSRIRSRIEEINGRFEDIHEQGTKLGLQRVIGETTSAKTWQKPTSTSLVNESSVYGRHEDKEKIIKLLLNDHEATNDKFCVIPIVGMGGVGKTTLAQLVYNHEAVQQHFDLKAWIKLKEALVTKKFLVVLDDVWNNKPTDWDVLWIPFGAGAQESRVIITTRDREVALRMGTDQNHCHYLNQLSDVDCWSVFKQYAFENRNTAEHQNLELIGKKIVEKCKGLPLAARTLGGILRSKLKEIEWEMILNSKIWDLTEKESDILPALRLSYHHLPIHLKRCFAYCSIFPKDYEFGDEEIVLLWMAEGFLQQQGEKQMEDLGHEYFRDLLSRSFFQQSTSNTSLFVMHDLINDLAQWVAGEKCFRLEDNLEGEKECKVSKNARHSSYIRGEYDGINKFMAFEKVVSLRTFLQLSLRDYVGGCYLTNNVHFVLLPKLRCLRVLSLRGYQILELPNSIGDLKHLRFLDLSHTPIRRLPESISTLYNLQTLILGNCRYLKMLPEKLSNIFNLRHLDITNVNSIKEMPLGIGKLTSLQTLTKFVVGESSGSRIRELGNWPHLRGTLCISNLQNVIEASDAREASLKDKHALDVLKMKWSSQFDGSRNESVEENVAHKLQPPKNLEKLSIKCYGGTRLPIWIGDPIALTHLVCLSLKDCVNCTSLAALGQLPLLKDLSIKGMSGVNTVGPEFNGIGCPKPFPSLETLQFENMQEWENWLPCEVDGHVEVFPCLLKLSITGCPKLLGKLPDHLPSLEEVMLYECQQLVVSISSFPKLCKLYISKCQEVVVPGSMDGLISLKFISLFEVTKPLTCLMQRFRQGSMEVENLSIGDCNIELTCLLGKEMGLLQNLTSLRQLIIVRCPEIISSVGEEKAKKGLHSLTSFRKLIIDGCPGLLSFTMTNLPPMLRELSIRSCSALKSLLLEMMHCGNNVSLLEYLNIENCYSLTSLPCELPATLKRFYVSSCPKLESVVELPASLEKTEFSRCRSLKSLPEGLHKLTNLSVISILNCPSLVSFPDEGLPATSLRRLYIQGCDELAALPNHMHNLTSLQHLTIQRCPSILSFPEQGFPTNLTFLVIRDLKICKPLFDWGLHRLTSLRQLEIEGPCPDLVSFPEKEKRIILPTSLTKLTITDFLNLEYLPFNGSQNVTFLKSLQISKCPNLKSFPKEGLPLSLLELSIESCPLLKERCKKNKGRDWPKIAHIPSVHIDHMFIYKK